MLTSHEEERTMDQTVFEEGAKGVNEIIKIKILSDVEALVLALVYVWYMHSIFVHGL